MIDIAEHPGPRGCGPDFKHFPRSAPDLDALEVHWSAPPARIVELDEEAG